MSKIFYNVLSKICIIAFLAASSAVMAQPPATVTFIDEDFNSCPSGPPAGWTDSIVEGPYNWVYNKNGFGGGSLNGSCAAVFDDDAGAAVNPPNHAWVESPKVDITNHNFQTLEFDYNFNNVGENERFVVSVWNGNAWVEVLYVENPVTGGNNGQRNFTMDVSKYANPNFQIRWEWIDEGAFSWGAGFDNVRLTGEEIVQYNARILRNYQKEYTLVPLTQTPFSVETTGENIGFDTLTDAVITTTISNAATGFVQTRSSDPHDLAPGDTFHFEWEANGFTPPTTGVYTIEHDITVNEPDQDPSNNSVAPLDQEFSLRLYARDDFNAFTSFGIGTEGSVGSEFDITRKSAIGGIQLVIGTSSNPPDQGDEFSVAIWNFDESAGIPDTVIKESENVTINSTAPNQLFNVEFEKDLILEPGIYVATLEEGDQVIPLVYSDDIYTPDRHWIKFGGNQFAIQNGWSNLDPFGSLNSIFASTPSVRANTRCVGIDQGNDTAICADVTHQLGGDPTVRVSQGNTSISWAPGDNLDDSTSANPTFDPPAPGTYEFTVTVFDSTLNCSESRTVTITATPRPVVGVNDLQTDYCIYESPDTIGFQPMGGEVTGPGVVIVDSGGLGGASGRIETIKNSNNFGSAGGMVYFTVDNHSGGDIQVTELGMNINTGSEVIIYRTPGGHAGKETNAGAWTQIGTADGTVNPLGVDEWSPAPVNGTVIIPSGVWGIALETPSAENHYTNGTGSNQTFSNSDLTLELGSASNSPFASPFTPRVWNGYIEYGSAKGDPPVYVFNPDSAGVGEHIISYCITNDLGCTGCDTAIVRVHDRPDPTINAPDVVCLNEQVTLTAATPLGTWSGPGIVDPQGGLFDASAAGIGNHKIYYEVVGPRGCFNEDSTMIEVIDIPSADAGMDMTVCRGSEVTVGGNPTGTPGASDNGFIDNYNWSPANGLSSSVDPNPVSSPEQTTVYTVTVTDNNGCTVSDNVEVEVRDTPKADAGPDVVSCDGDPVIIGGSPSASNGTPPYTYNWSPAAGLDDPSAASPTADPDVSTTYTLTVTDANGCRDEDVVNVPVKSSPVADAGNDAIVCSDEVVNLGGAPTGSGGNPPYTYSWNPSSNLSSGQVANPEFSFTNTNANPVPKVYTVTVTDKNGCTSTDVIEVTVRPAVFVDAGPDTAICTGNSVKLGGVAPASNGIPPYNYNWGPTVGVTTPSKPNPVATPTSSTIYTLTVTDGEGCEGEDQVEVTVNSLPKVEAGPDQTICYGNTVQIGGEPTADVGQAPYEYEWSPYIGLNNENLSNPLAGPNSDQNFTVTVTDANGCEESDVVTVFVNEKPVAHAGVDKQICIGESVEIGAKPAASNGTPPYQYTWTPNKELNDEQVENPIASPNTTTTYNLKVTDKMNCSDVDKMVVTVNELPDVDIVNLPTDFCLDDSLVMLEGDPTGGVFTGNGVFGSTFFPTSAGVGQHDIKYIYTDENGCTDSTFQIVDIHGLPDIDAGEDQEIYLSEDTRMDATSDGNYDYTWTPGGNLSDPNVLNPDVLGLEETTTFTVEAENQWGCISTDEMTIVVDVNLPINPPNMFTPNSDGTNDEWVIDELAFFPNNNLKVFNRYGQLVYEGENLGPNAWDGDGLSEGTYYWVLRLEVQGNTVHRGTITIKR